MKPYRPPSDPHPLREKFAAARKELSSALIEREDEIDLVLTVLLSGEHVLLVGPPGCGKSLLLDSLLSWTGGTKFNLLFTKFTVPEECFGPVSLRALKEDKVRARHGRQAAGSRLLLPRRGHEGVLRRPRWSREVFRGPKSERLDLAPFAARLTKLRENRGWTKKRLAIECDLSPSVIGVWEAGKKGPTWPTLAKLAKGLEVGYEQLGVPSSLAPTGHSPVQTNTRRGPARRITPSAR